MFSFGMEIGAGVFVLSIGAYLYGVSLSKEIKVSLFAINRNSQSKTDQTILLGQIIEFLEVHSSGQRLSRI